MSNAVETPGCHASLLGLSTSLEANGLVEFMTARILIIAGSDSGGGAGIQADIKTVTMLGGHAMTAITAVTAQNTMSVDRAMSLPPSLVIQQMDAVCWDIGIDAIKIGMLGSREIATEVASELATDQYRFPIVFDPVMLATSGSTLADGPTIEVMDHIARMSTVITPNLPELAVLCGCEIKDNDHAVAEAKDYAARIGAAVLVKGGHSESVQIVDTLVEAHGQTTSWEGTRIETTSTHGTGCTLSTAIAVCLGQGMELIPAITRARQFVRAALHAAPGLGMGHGPMGHQNVRNDVCIGGPSLNQVTVAASDYSASVAFYKSLGLRQIVDSPDNGYARFEAANGATLSLHQDHNFVPASGTVIYFESWDLDGWVAQLKRQGVEFTSAPQDRDWLWRDAYLCDPFGNLICLYQAGENRRFPLWRVTL